MHRKLKVILVALCALFAVAFSGTTVNAAATTNNLPNSFLIGDQDGVYVDVSGEYFIDARDLQPGDVITRRLTIQNLEQADRAAEAKIPYTLTMRAEPLLSSGPVDLLDAVHLELKLDGKTIYSGRCRGDEGVNMIQNALALGVYKMGDRRTLDITLTVSPEMQLFEEESEADFKWIFYAWRDSDADAPKTGVVGYSGYVLAAATNLLSLFLFLKKKKQRQAQAVLSK